MQIDQTTVKRIANLARIDIKDNELDAMADRLSRIIGFMEQLNEVDISDVTDTPAVMPMDLKWREDTPTTDETGGDKPAQILSNAPMTREGFFAVPKVVE